MLNNEELDKKIGQRIKECRMSTGYSQSNLAEVLGFDSPTAISLIENGERGLKIRDLIILCQLFMKDYEYFIGAVPKGKVKEVIGNDPEELARKLLRIAKHKKSLN